jgi:hypothetical protein
MRQRAAPHMYVFMFVLPERKLNREQLAKLQELAGGFGALVANQLEAYDDGEGDEDFDDESPIVGIEASEQPIHDPTVIGYLEDCFRLQ